MIGKDSIMYSLRNLAHRKGRSFLTVFSILVGIATIFIFISYGYGLYDYTNEVASSSSADKLLITAKGSGVTGIEGAYVINEEDLKVIKRASGVNDATGLYFSPVEVENSGKKIYTYLVSYDPSKPLVMELFNTDVEAGRELRQGETKKVFAGYNYMIDGKIFDRGLKINDVIEVNSHKMKIIGFMSSVGSPPDDAQLYVTNDYYEELFSTDSGYSQIIAKADINEISKAVENVERGLRKHRNLEKGKEDFFVQTFEDMIASFKTSINIIVAFVILIALISVLVSAINTANTMITSVLERYKEIGILKSVGARNSEIFGIFLFESSFLGFVAGVLGVLLGFGITSLANFILNSLGWGFLKPVYSILFPYDIFVYCILFAMITGIISGVIPAHRASKTNTVDALRYE